MNDGIGFVYLVRHVQSVANENPKLYNEYVNKDIPLSDRGDHQAEYVGKLIAEDYAKDQEDPAYRDNTQGRPSIAYFSSPYLRCRKTAEGIRQGMGEDFHRPIRENLLLSEMCFGEQEGCNVEDFSERPVENIFRNKIGNLHYKPNRAESYLDLHTRMGLFVVQRKFFDYCTANIIVSHASACLMMHYFLTETCPEDEVLSTPACEYWGNGVVRKYHRCSVPIGASSPFTYQGILQEDVKDVLI